MDYSLLAARLSFIFIFNFFLQINFAAAVVSRLLTQQNTYRYAHNNIRHDTFSVQSKIDASLSTTRNQAKQVALLSQRGRAMFRVCQ